MAASNIAMTTGVKRRREEEDDSKKIVILPVTAPLGHVRESFMPYETLQGSRYDVHSSKFFQTIHIQHNDPFDLTTTTIMEGPLAGRQVILLKPVKPFRLMDLPAELRTQIYEYVFPKSEIKIPYKSKSGLKRRLAGRQNGIKSISRQREATATELVTIRFQRPSGLNLLRASKQLLEEAAPVAYGNRTFVGLDHEVSNFLENLGPMCKYIKHLHIHNTNETVGHELRTGVENLHHCTDLRSLVIDHDYVCQRRVFVREYDWNRAIEKCVRILLEPLRTIRRLCMQENLSAFQDIVQIRPEKCGTCHSRYSLDDCKPDFRSCATACGEKMQHHCAVLETKIRLRLVESLEGEEAAPTGEKESKYKGFLSDESDDEY